MTRFSMELHSPGEHLAVYFTRDYILAMDDDVLEKFLFLTFKELERKWEAVRPLRAD